MKISRTKIRMMLIAFVTLAIVSCTPEDGDTGPVGPVGSPGPAGATGPAGPAGQNGQDGTDGTDGNANVQAYTFTVQEADFTASASAAGTNFRIRHRDTLNVTQITNDVMLDGTVQVFFNSATFSSDPNAWTPMPSSDLGVTFNYHVALGEIRIDINYINGPSGTGQPQAIPIGDFDFKVVVIPPASLVKNMDYKNHEMLQALYGI